MAFRSKLSLGGAQFGLEYGIANRRGQVSKSALKKILSFSSDSGVTMIDTAQSYGESELHLGFAGVEEFKLVTKIKIPEAIAESFFYWAEESIIDSLEKLKIKNLYGLLIHNPERLLCSDGDEIMTSLERLKELGYFKKIGISIYDYSVLKKLLERYKLDIVQAPFNLVDRRLSEDGWLIKLNALGIEVHVRSIFLQGLLTIPENKMPKYFARWHNKWETWWNWLYSNNISAPHACLHFILSFKGIDKVIIGIDSVEQLKDLVSQEKNILNYKFPEICSEDKMLINPSNWIHVT